MKKLSLLGMMCLVALSFGLFANCSEESGSGSGSGGNGNNSAYVDLGLPSGTKWKTQNEGVNSYYTFDEAVSRFGNQLPSQAQWIELYNECTWYWNGDGYSVFGPNGNSIDLPALGRNYNNYENGLNGYYWTSTSAGAEVAKCMFFDASHGYIISDYRYEALSVRLVQQGR